jgi:hypothetical protein
MSDQLKPCVACDCVDNDQYYSPGGAGPFGGACWQSLTDADQSLSRRSGSVQWISQPYCRYAARSTWFVSVGRRWRLGQRIFVAIRLSSAFCPFGYQPRQTMSLDRVQPRAARSTPVCPPETILGMCALMVRTVNSIRHGYEPQ